MTVVDVRSYSRYSGRIRDESETGTPSGSSAAKIAFSCSVFANENSSETAIDSTFLLRNLSISFRDARGRAARSIDPSYSVRSRTPKRRVVGHERIRPRDENVVEVPARLPADDDHIFETFGRQQSGPRAFAFQQGIGRDGGSMNDFPDRATSSRSSPCMMASSGWCGVESSLKTSNLAVLNDDEIGECSTGIDADSRIDPRDILNMLGRNRFQILKRAHAGRVPRSAPEGRGERRRIGESQLRAPMRNRRPAKARRRWS